MERADETAKYLATAAFRSRQVAVVLWVVYLILIVVVRLVSLVVQYHCRSNIPLALACTGTHTRWLSQRVLHTRLARFTYHLPIFSVANIPTYGESAVIGAYLAANILACSVGYTGYTNQSALRKAVAMRTGTLAFANYPLLVGLVGRNVAIARLTGVSRASLRTLHRWSGRLVAIFSLAHTIAYLSVYHASATPSRSFTSILQHCWEARFFRAGAVAMIAASILLFGSWHVLRQRCYELFLTLHILSAVVLLFASLLHERWSSNATSVIIWVYLGLGLWALDYFNRGLNMLYCCFARRLPQATLTCLPGDITQVDIALPSGCLLEPGATVYLCQWQSWQWHPFTVLANDLTDDTLVPSIKPEPARQDSMASVASDKTLVNATITTLSKVDEECGCVEDVSQISRIRLLVKAQGGLTRHLHDLATTAARRSRQPAVTRVLLDGPYMEKRSVHHNMRNLLLMAGGVGITAVFPAFQEACLHSTARHLQLIWIIRTRAESHVLKRQIEACLARANATPLGHRASATIYVTREGAPATEDPSTPSVQPPCQAAGRTSWQPRWRQSFQETSQRRACHRIQYMYGKPDVAVLLAGAVDSVQAGLGYSAQSTKDVYGFSAARQEKRSKQTGADGHLLHVHVCGSLALSEDVRLASGQRSLGEGTGAVEVVFEVLR
ncbi:hypothetical protein BCR37DRAFT_232290 [Protomyces lactucae-debilis]|uniref:FAD-binding FR-type domain-containing protein n=1 Tax=Protomyces lactucae-debilis TaxID=2754530 RepID=A0A1Y2ERK4_PROLT|nr:uncharacterized protein BCR37DRAFT_232290 [Protomyces lactucae-debilis]ORY73475.1 hypothetical protein BCR37DRAFT_232290 [Protomyces lactucae-debilis]